MLRYLKIITVTLPYCCFYCIFEQTNVAFVRLSETLENLTRPQIFEWQCKIMNVVFSKLKFKMEVHLKFISKNVCYTLF